MMEKKIVLSDKLNTSSRTYFFDVKETTKGKPYLVLTESYKQKDSETFTRNSLLIFEEDFQKFSETLNNVMAEVPVITAAQKAE